MNAETGGADLTPNINVGAFAKTTYDGGNLGQPSVQARRGTFPTGDNAAWSNLNTYSYHSYGERASLAGVNGASRGTEWCWGAQHLQSPPCRRHPCHPAVPVLNCACRPGRRVHPEQLQRPADKQQCRQGDLWSAALCRDGVQRQDIWRLLHVGAQHG
jgi:hypothetical protein